jgi:hypothetical protein
MNPLQELKSWILTNALLILGVVLALTAGYAAFLRFVTIPVIEADGRAAKEAAAKWQSATGACQAANLALGGSIKEQNKAVEGLALAGREEPEGPRCPSRKAKRDRGGRGRGAALL